MNFVLIIFSIVITISSISATRVVCEYRTRSYQRIDNNKLDPIEINPKLCTHIHYASLAISADFKLTNQYGDESEIIQKIMLLKLRNPSLKVIATLGGSDQFYIFISEFGKKIQSSSNRMTFLQSVIQYLRINKFDGLDIGWKYPSLNGDVDEKDSFILLLHELKSVFRSFNYILSITVGVDKESVEVGYDVIRISSIVDYINLMSYELTNQHDGLALHGAQVRPTKSDLPIMSEKTQESIINHWLSLGAPAEKLNLGIPFYGKAFTLEDPLKNTPGSIITGYSGQKPITIDMFSFNYRDTCLRLRTGWMTGQSEYSPNAPYIYGTNSITGSTEWAGIENTNSVAFKTSFAVGKGLGGVYASSIDRDDFSGSYCDQGRFPLLTAINNALGNFVQQVLTPGQCVLDSGFDYIGNDVFSVEAECVDVCCNLCLQIAGCESWSFSNQVCWLKSGLGLPKTANSAVISGYVVK